MENRSSIRPRSTRSTASACSKISLCMYVSWPPMSQDSASYSTVVGVAEVREPSVV